MTPLTQLQVEPQILAAARAGDRAAQGELYGRVAAPTLRLLGRLVPGHAAEDVFQDTMMAVFARLQEFRGDAPFGAWVRAIAVNRALMHLRSPWHRLRIWVAAGVEATADERQGAAAVERTEAIAVRIDLASLLDRLPPASRAVLWLYEVEGYSHEEIARAFGRSVSFSKSQVARAHRRLQHLTLATPAAAPTPRGEAVR
jgi:RNA polymerase sigma factor (sigma-70 family)